MNTRRFTSLAASTALLTTLAACGGSGAVTFAQAQKDHNKAQQACQSALGSDQKKLAALDPGETVPNVKYKVTGLFTREGSEQTQLRCTVTGSDFHNQVTFSPNNDAYGGVVVQDKGLFAWVNGADSGADYPAQTSSLLTDAVKKLAG